MRVGGLRWGETDPSAARTASINWREVVKAMDVSITTLGDFAISIEGVLVDQAEWRRRQAAALVKILALAPRRTLHREQVMDVLWPGLSVDEAAPRLHKAAHYARRALGRPSSVVLAGESVALFPQQDVHIDAHEFAALADSALAARDPETAARAADAYGGELLPQDRYEAWAEDHRERLRLLYLDVLRLSGRWEVLCGVDPTDEEAHLRVITELARRGERRAALRQFERLERALRQELGVSPSRTAVALRASLQTAEVPSTHDPAPPDPRPGLPPLPLLVGGAADHARLDRVLDAVSTGRGHMLFIAGSAGTGKTALAAWLEHAATKRGLRVGSGVAAQIEGAWPYAPVLEALADLCRRHPALLDGLDDTLRAEIERGLWGREVEWTAQSGHQRLFVAAAELVRLAAAGNGAVLVIDDAQHADDASLRLLHYLARSTVSERVLLVVAHRPQVSAELAQIRQSLRSRGTAVTLDVSPLTYTDVAELTRQLSPASTDDFVDAVWTASVGLPFSVVELARAGATQAPLPAASFLPTALTGRQVQALAAAAVLGSTFDTDEFLAVTGLADDEAYTVLDAALNQRLVVRSDTGYEFRHTILRDALLAGLSPSQLRALHRQAAAALESLRRSPRQIGHHLVQAGDQAGAVPWMVRAAETAAALGAYPEALSTLEAVRAQADGRDLAKLLSLRADLLMARADAGAVDAYRDALGVVTDPADRERLRARLARAATFAGDLETAAIALDGLVTDDSGRDTELLLAQGNLALFQGDLEAAEVAASEARRRVTLGGQDEWQTFDVIGLQGLVAHNRGEWFQRLRLELRSGVRRPALAARIFDSHLCVAEFLLYGPTPYPEVLGLAASLRETAERSGVLRAVAFATALRGETALLMGDLGLAGAELQDAVDLHRDIGSAAGEAHSLQRLAEVKLALGDRVEAKQLLRRALTVGRFTSLAKHLIQRVYGTMIIAEEDPAAARAMADQAEASLGFDDHCPFCIIMLAIPSARACADVGDTDAARRHLGVAERSARMWEGTSWQASIVEVKAHLAAAENDPASAQRLALSAAELFDASSQPLDAVRCRSYAVMPTPAETNASVRA
jgi:DNA-binding SARP family transcriptional activator/tetratricopeptide (TPR) repeat protein